MVKALQWFYLFDDVKEIKKEKQRERKQQWKKNKTKEKTKNERKIERKKKEEKSEKRHFMHEFDIKSFCVQLENVEISKTISIKA